MSSKRMRRVMLLNICLLILVFGFRSQPLAAQNRSADVTQAGQQQLLENYGKLPLSFEVNQGQTDAKVKFLSRRPGLFLFLTPTESVLAFSKAAQEGDPETPQGAHPATPRKVQTNALRVRLVGANPAPSINGLEELATKSNYFIGNDPKKWQTNVPNYAKVEYVSVYPGVDVVYYGNEGRLEHDFIVSPGGDARAITLGFDRAKKLRINDHGDVVVSTGVGEARLEKPVVYQEVGGVRRQVAGRYVQRGRNQIGFRVGKYDVTKPLVIDPVLSYSTYVSPGLGSGGAMGTGIAVDSTGNAYVAGTTNSPNFPTSAGAYQTTVSSGTTLFVMKLNAAGSAVIYSTYVGNQLYNNGFPGPGIAVDSAGSAYVTGSTASTSFPTTPGAFQASLLGSANVFVTKLDPTGSQLVYSTYLGGWSFDDGAAIAVDSYGSAYVTGESSSFRTDCDILNTCFLPPFPVTSGAYQTTVPQGEFACFITKLNTLGTGLDYSTWLASSNSSDRGLPSTCQAIALDSSGSAYVTGYTEQRAYPTTPGAFQTYPSPASAFTAFVTKLTPDGSNLAYSTYLSGNANGSAAGGIAVDSAGSAYVTGAVGSPNSSFAANSFPTTPGAFQTSFAGPAGAGDFFITKLTADGSGVIYSTYLGIRATNTFYCANNACPNIAVDSAGSASVAATSISGSLGGSIPTTPDAVQTVNRGTQNAFVSKLTPDGSGLIYSTYLGGSIQTFGLGIALDPAGSIYVTGYAGSSDFPTTANSVYPVYNSSTTATGFVVKFGQASTTTTLTSSLNPSLSGQTVTFTATVTSPSPGTPTGTVAFYDGATSLGSSILSGTQATFSTSSLSLGPHTITAVYSGDTNFKTSTSPPVIQSVVGSSVNLSIGAPGVTYGTAANATVSASSQGGTVTGNVTLSVDGGAPVSASLSNGSATFNLGILGAGSHSLSANYTAQGSFLASMGSGSVTVSPAPLTITASSGSTVYGGPVFSVTPSYTGFVNGDTAASLTTAPTCTTTATNTSAVGTYTSSCSGAVDSNYAFSYVGGTVTVTPAATTLTASVAPSSVTYGTPASVTVSVTSAVGTVPGNVTLSIDGSAASTMALSNGSATFNLGILPAGNHALTPGFAAQGNFQGSSAQAPLVVKQAPATVTANPAGKTYGTADPQLTATEIGFIAADAVTIVLSATRAPGESVGTYAITPSAMGAALANYSVTYTPGTFTINTASATVTANAASKTYGTADQALSAGEAGFTAADAATIVLSATRAMGESVGTYIITPSATGAALANYSVTYAPATFTINKASATVSATAAGKTYGTTDPSLTATETGFTSADAATITLSATRAMGESVGTYIITPSATGAALANYSLNYTPAAFTINKATASVTATAASKTYGTTDPTLPMPTESGLTSADAATITLSATRAAGESVGTYTITPSATGAALANYSVTYTPATFTINKASATVTATSASKTYGTADPSLTATETGFTAADAATITLSATRTLGESVGTYIITPSATGTALANYSVTYTSATFTINQAMATVMLGNLTQRYAGIALAPTATTVPSGLALTLVGAPDTSVATYAVIATVNNTNYSGSASGMFVITPVMLTVTANSVTRVFGVANPAFTWNATGFVNGENTSVFTANPTCTTTATISSPVGTYPITCSGAAAQNYSFTYVSGTLTITSNGTGALSKGFWNNPNGQMIIKNNCNPSGGTSLMTFLTGFNPFQDDTATTCASEAAYVSSIINAATCSGSICNTMLRAQMLATALDVYFSTPGLGGNRIGTYNGLGSKTPPLGGAAIDLSSICSMVDGSTGSNCSGTFEDTRSEFGITTPYAGTTVLQLLSYTNYASAINGNPVAISATGQVWYMQNKVRQTIAKDVFDNINNDIARIASAGSITNPSF